MLTFNEIKNAFVTNRETVKGKVCIISNNKEIEIKGVQTLQNQVFVLSLDNTWFALKEEDTVTILPK